MGSYGYVVAHTAGGGQALHIVQRWDTGWNDFSYTALCGTAPATKYGTGSAGVRWLQSGDRDYNTPAEAAAARTVCKRCAAAAAKLTAATPAPAEAVTEDPAPVLVYTVTTHGPSTRFGTVGPVIDTRTLTAAEAARMRGRFSNLDAARDEAARLDLGTFDGSCTGWDRQSYSFSRGHVMIDIAEAPAAPAEAEAPAAEDVSNTAPVNRSQFAMSYPALDGAVVMQGHADYCREHGHATWTVDGVDTGTCPRCGVTTAPAEAAPAEDTTEDAPAVFQAKWDYVESHGLQTVTPRPGYSVTLEDRRTGQHWSGDSLQAAIAAHAAAAPAEAPAPSRESHDISAAWKFVSESYGDYSPARRDWTDADIFAFVAEYHTGGLDAVKFPAAPEAMARATELALMSAPGATRVDTDARLTAVSFRDAAAAVTAYYTGGPGRGECIDAVIVSVLGGSGHYARTEAARMALESLTDQESRPVTAGQYQTIAAGPGRAVLFIFGTWED